MTSLIREDQVDATLDDCLVCINKKKLSTEEIVMLVSQLLVQCGFSIHFGHRPRSERPKTVDRELADELAVTELTTGTALMKLGFDIVDALLQRKES